MAREAASAKPKGAVVARNNQGWTGIDSTSLDSRLRHGTGFPGDNAGFLIDGKLVQAVSGMTFEVHNPARATVIANVRRRTEPAERSDRVLEPPDGRGMYWSLYTHMTSDKARGGAILKLGTVDGFGRVADFSKTLRVGDGRDPDTRVGPLVSQEQLTRVTGYLDIGRQEGARPLSGGERLTDGPLAKGYFVSSTVFADVRDDMRIAQEEIFGPVISAIPFTDIEEVIERGNKTQFSLGSGVWTRDVGKAHRLARAIRAGSVWINCCQAMDPAVLFGGYEMSGYGRESGVQRLKEYLNVKSVWIKTD